MSIRPQPLRLALALLAVAPLGHAQTSVSHLLTDLRSPDPALRDNAAQQLGKTHSPRAIPPLIAALTDTNLHVASDAATALGQMRAIPAIQPLIDSLHHTYCSGIVTSNPHAAAALSAIGMPAVPAMLQALSHSSYGISGDISFELEHAFDGIQSPEIVPPLAALLKSPNDQARIYAAERLGKHPGTAAVDALLPMLHDPNEYVRDHAIYSLGENLKDPRVVPALREVAEEPAHSARRSGYPQIAALRTLADAHDPALIPVFIDGLKYPDIGENEASMALLDLGPVTIDPLIAALADTARPAEARYWAAITLGQFHAPGIPAALLAASYDPKRRVREGALTTTVANTDPSFTGRLLTALAEDKSPRVRQLAGYSLATHDDPRINPALIAALKDPDENVRAAAADSLAKRHATGAIPQLVDYMHGKAILDHQQGAQALGNMRDPRALDPLRDIRDRSSGGDRIVAKQALAHLEKDLYSNGNQNDDAPNGSKGSTDIDSAIAALRSPDAPTRAHAAEILSARQRPGAVDPRAIDPLLQALDDPGQEVRRRAAIALINVDDPRKIVPFSSLLRSPDFALREYAAVGLGHVHDPRAVAALIAALGDPDFNTHRGLMDALQPNTYAPVLPALLAALRSPNPVVRAGAAEALRYRTEPSVSRALIPLEHDTNPHVREVAQQALSGCPVPPVLD